MHGRTHQLRFHHDSARALSPVLWGVIVTWSALWALAFELEALGPALAACALVTFISGFPAALERESVATVDAWYERSVAPALVAAGEWWSRLHGSRPAELLRRAALANAAVMTILLASAVAPRVGLVPSALSGPILGSPIGLVMAALFVLATPAALASYAQLSSLRQRQREPLFPSPLFSARDAAKHIRERQLALAARICALMMALQVVSAFLGE